MASKDNRGRMSLRNWRVILDTLRKARQPVKMREMAEMAEVSTKTIQREVEFLRDFFDMPIEGRRMTQTTPPGIRFEPGKKACCPLCEADITNTHHGRN